MRRPEVSIIVSIYNKQKEIKKCLESIRNQTFTDFEVLMIDDGSTDRTPEICKAFTEKDVRFQHIYKKNGGLEASRRTGYLMAKGKYFAFVDGDDWLPENGIELLYEEAINSEADIVIGNHKRVIGRLSPISVTGALDSKQYEGEEAVHNGMFSVLSFGVFPAYAWGKLYNRNLFDEAIKLGHIFMGEDAWLNTQLFLKANKITTISSVVYYYRWGGGSEKLSYNNFLDLLTVNKMIREYYEKKISII